MIKLDTSTKLVGLGFCLFVFSIFFVLEITPDFSYVVYQEVPNPESKIVKSIPDEEISESSLQPTDFQLALELATLEKDHAEIFEEVSPEMQVSDNSPTTYYVKVASGIGMFDNKQPKMVHTIDLSDEKETIETINSVNPYLGLLVGVGVFSIPFIWKKITSKKTVNIK